MKIQNIGLASLLGSLGVIASSMTAQALDFNFSFNADQGFVGTVSGIIRGVDNNGVINNAQLEVLSSPVGNSVGIYDTSGQYSGGAFSLNNNEIVGADSVAFYSGVFDRYVLFNFGGWNSLTSTGDLYSYITDGGGGNLGGFAGATFTSATPVSVPFDFSPVAIGVPLVIGLGMLKKKIN